MIYSWGDLTPLCSLDGVTSPVLPQENFPWIPEGLQHLGRIPKCGTLVIIPHDLKA